MPRKPQDLTLRNLRATKKREADIQSALIKRIKGVDLTLASWILDLDNRLVALETRVDALKGKRT